MRIAILLAAGASRRMGRSKLDLPVEGKPMCRRVAETLLAAGFDRVRVVVAPGAGLDLPPDDRVEVVVNPRASEGIATSIGRGLEGLPPATELAAIALADLPLLRRETLDALLGAWDRRTADRRILYPEYEGRQGHPVLWDPSLFDELRSLAGDRGAKDVLERHRGASLGVPVDDPGVCLDIDTPDDYARLRGFSPEASGDPGKRRA